MSGSAPCLKYTVIIAIPELVAVDVMYVMFSTPLILSSRGVMTEFNTVCASAPVYDVDTIIVGGAMSGYCSIGRLTSPIVPSSTKNMEITVESTGRFMNLENDIFSVKY